MRRSWMVWRRCAVVAASMMAVALLLAACAGGDDEVDLPTTTAEATVPVLPPTASSATDSVSAASGNVITDYQCEAIVPDGWLDDGTGRGSTVSGHPFVLFGGTVRSEADWQATADLLATPPTGYAIASIERTDDSIYAVYRDGRGFEFRKRFGDRYCDFRVISRGTSIAEEEQAEWDAVIRSMRPV